MNIVADKISIDFSTGDCYVSRVITNDLSISANTGDAEVTDCKLNNELAIKLTTGDVDLSNNEINGDLKVTTGTGSQEIEHVSCSNITLKATSGEVSLEDVIANKDMTINTNTGKVELEYSDANNIYIETTTKNDKVFVSIKDTGIGIPKDSIHKIWDRFYKSDLSRGKDKKGTGLGLAIVKEIVQAHNENINVISTEGVGTEFIFTLPLSEKEV